MKEEYVKQKEAGAWTWQQTETEYVSDFDLPSSGLSSYQDWELLERFGGPEGAREEGVGGQSHQEVSGQYTADKRQKTKSHAYLKHLDRMVWNHIYKVSAYQSKFL